MAEIAATAAAHTLRIGWRERPRAGVSLVEAPLAARLHVHVLRAIARALGTRTVDTGRFGLIP